MVQRKRRRKQVFPFGLVVLGTILFIAMYEVGVLIMYLIGG